MAVFFFLNWIRLHQHLLACASDDPKFGSEPGDKYFWKIYRICLLQFCHVEDMHIIQQP